MAEDKVLLLSTTDSEATGIESADIYGVHLENSRYRRLRNLNAFLIAAVGVLSIIVLLQQLHYSSDPPTSNGMTLEVFTSGLNLVRDKERVADVPTRFLSHNKTETAKSWDAIEAGHGLVAVDPQWASTRNLPDTMVHPRDSTKAVYIIAAYHAIHCLKFIRKHYMSMSAGEPIEWESGHDLHCFDSIRQQLMCAADDTLLYTTGHRDAGHGQVRMCRDWDALREWATENTACYADHEWPAKTTRWGNCDGGVDGLPVGNLLD